jgi:hypothetical protein
MTPYGQGKDEHVKDEHMQVTSKRFPGGGRSGLLVVALAAAMLLSLTACEDDSPAGDTPGGGTDVGSGGTEVDDLTGGDGTGTGGDGTGTVLPQDTSPGATDAPNPYAGGGGGAGTGTSAP